ncbi:sushi domain protein [Oesophagostomum dentatum]|uniref:Sushi domain protein n=1 Tax=Oesophagostomum dentatum TaxID=61180 RepID=A0A0B1SQ58_OESDE|nr:sushi domain protein [Oesophagostomum dentatum]
MKQVVFFLIITLIFIGSEAGELCEPLEDTPTARLTYHSGTLVMVRPRDPLPDGTTATLKCNFGTSATGSTTATCVNGQWKGIPIGKCT